MKAQALPMKTIAIIIIVLIAMVVFLTFFFGVFSKGKITTERQNLVARCNALCAEIVAGATKDKFCNLGCDKYVTCINNTIKITCS